MSEVIPLPFDDYEIFSHSSTTTIGIYREAIIARLTSKFPCIHIPSEDPSRIEAQSSHLLGGHTHGIDTTIGSIASEVSQHSPPKGLAQLVERGACQFYFVVYRLYPRTCCSFNRVIQKQNGGCSENVEFAIVPSQSLIIDFTFGSQENGQVAPNLASSLMKLDEERSHGRSRSRSRTNSMRAVTLGRELAPSEVTRRLNSSP